MNKLILIFGLILFTTLNYHETAIAKDNIPPEVISTSPNMRAKNVLTNSNISAYFSEPMNPASITSNTFTLANSFGTQIPGSVTYANRSTTFNPFNKMSGMTTYIATIHSTVTDFAGNPLGRSYSWSFMTGHD